MCVAKSTFEKTQAISTEVNGNGLLMLVDHIKTGSNLWQHLAENISFPWNGIWEELMLGFTKFF